MVLYIFPSELFIGPSFSPGVEQIISGQDGVKERGNAVSSLQVCPENRYPRIVTVDIRLHAVQVCPTSGEGRPCLSRRSNSRGTSSGACSPHRHPQLGSRRRSVFRPQPEVSRADHVADVLDKEDIDGIKRKVLDRVLDQMCIEMAFLPVIGVIPGMLGAMIRL